MRTGTAPRPTNAVTDPARSTHTSFGEFYPSYLAEHRNATSRRLHFIGSCGVVALLVAAAASGNPWGLAGAPLCGDGFAWVGHDVYEKNRPATFRHPLYSLLGDWVMFKDILVGRMPF